MDQRRTVNWSALAPELLSMIGNRLDAPMDLLGFRSVCRSWRSSTSPRSYHTGGADGLLSPPPKFPCPFASGRDAFVSESTIYRLEPVHHDDDDNNAAPDGPDSRSVPAKALFVKIEVTEPDKLAFLFRRADDPQPPIPKVLSTLDYRMVKLCNFNTLTCPHPQLDYSLTGVCKVIRYPVRASISAEDWSIFVIFNGGKLGFAKRGDRELTLVGDCNDLIVHRGRPYVVDGRGKVSWIDYPSLKLTQVSTTSPTTTSSSSGSDARKHLVESGGELYVVDRHFETEEQWRAAAAAAAAAAARTTADDQAPHDRLPLRLPGFRAQNPPSLTRGKTVDFKVYKLDVECGNCEEVTDLGDEAFFLCDDMPCSVLASEFQGCKKNCIYYTDRHEGSLFSHPWDGCVFSLENRSIRGFCWPSPFCFSNSQLNRRLWVLDCSIKPPVKPTMD